MHGHVNVKFVSAKQAKEIYQYRNIKSKLYETNGAIWYNKACREKHLTTNYISIRINGKNLQWQKTVRAAAHVRLNQEIKILYIKKRKKNLMNNCTNTPKMCYHMAELLAHHSINIRQQTTTRDGITL